ncbi:MAG: proton-conducting transporter membrane subunit [Eubacteriales bacterium]|nr:proton-conducting transporter membrane subunit [Eubacteriales bacterium]
MSQYWILAAILLPIIGGILTPLLPFKKRTHMMFYLETIMLVTSAIVLALVAHGRMEVFHVIRFVRNLSISFKIDGMSMIFGGLIAVLWPLAMLYSFEYMEHESHEKIFFAFYSITYGVTLGIAFASDMLSMYFFYELLTLVTVPLIVHPLTREAILATRKYLYYSIGGAAFALIGLIFLIVYGTTCEFQMGGVLDMTQIAGKENTLLLIYMLAFFGFGVKAAIWPLSSWLPQAGVAPTPVTALLHAVAVVKAGVFAIIRLTYYSFGTDFLRGTWVQYVVMGFAMFTIVYGCSRAVKETHIKRRLAYSTVSNLSYVIFGATIMTPLGMVGAVCHLVCHAMMKICSFLCAGAIMHQTDKHYIYELNGMGRKMPIVFGCFTVSALGLMGVPGLAGFISKWNLAKAAVESGNVQAYLGIGCLLISALLTAIYMMSIVVRAFFPGKDFDYSTLEGIKDPTWKMCLPLCLFAVGIVCLGLFSAPLVSFFGDVAAGVF